MFANGHVYTKYSYSKITVLWRDTTWNAFGDHPKFFLKTLPVKAFNKSLWL
jgi:hypothetical protein